MLWFFIADFENLWKNYWDFSFWLLGVWTVLWNLLIVFIPIVL